MLKKIQIIEWLLESQEYSAASILEQCEFVCEHVDYAPVDSFSNQFCDLYGVRIGAPAKTLKLVETGSEDFGPTIEESIYKIASAIDCNIVTIKRVPRLKVTKNLSDLPEIRGLIHKIAVVCKDYYMKRTIDDLFIFAGANREWWKESNVPHESERMSHVFGWIEGIEAHAPDQLPKIIDGVTTQIRENDIIPDGDRKVLGQRVHQSTAISTARSESLPSIISYPKDIEELLESLIRGLPRAMHPLKDRRKGLQPLSSIMNTMFNHCFTLCCALGLKTFVLKNILQAMQVQVHELISCVQSTKLYWRSNL